MREMFKGYYCPSEIEFARLWQECLFVFDANVLLNLYRYTAETRDELLVVLTRLSSRIWLPHQAALEYHENRLKVIGDVASTFDSVSKLCQSASSRLMGELSSHSRHPSVDVDSLKAKITTLFSEIESEIHVAKKAHPDLISDDPILGRITELFDGKVGGAYTHDMLSQIYREGDKRFEDKIPPGFRDTEKSDNRKYGDLILWKQILDKGKSDSISVILITDDSKDDWWWTFKGKTIGPHPQLVEEFRRHVSSAFYMYPVDPFLVHARTYLSQAIKEASIEEVRKLRRQDDLRRIQALEHADHLELMAEAMDAVGRAGKSAFSPDMEREMRRLKAARLLNRLREGVYRPKGRFSTKELKQLREVFELDQIEKLKAVRDSGLSDEEVELIKAMYDIQIKSEELDLGTEEDLGGNSTEHEDFVSED